MSMLEEIMRMMAPEERLAEFGTVEEKRRYIEAKRLGVAGWENTIFPRGKMARGESLRKDSGEKYLQAHAGHGGRRSMGASRPSKTLKSRRTR